MSGIAGLLGAVRRGDAKAVEDLLAAQPDLANARDDAGNSPIRMATYTGKPDVVRLLLDRGARPSFFEACAVGLETHIRRALGDNPAAVRQWAHDGWTPLHLACCAAAGPRADRRPDIIRLLIARGCPVDGRGSPSGHTPLHEAAYNGDLPVVRVLLQAGADRSLRTAQGQTAKEIAGQHGRHEVAGLL